MITVKARARAYSPNPACGFVSLILLKNAYAKRGHTRRRISTGDISEDTGLAAASMEASSAKAMLESNSCMPMRPVMRPVEATEVVEAAWGNETTQCQ